MNMQQTTNASGYTRITVYLPGSRGIVPRAPRARCDTPLMEDLAVLDVVPNEVLADLICSLLEEAEIPCTQRLTNVGGAIPVCAA